MAGSGLIVAAAPSSSWSEERTRKRDLGGRHELYERNYAGNIESIKVETFLAAQAVGDRAYLEGLVQNCLNDYDLTGWTGPTWCGPVD